MVWVTWRQHRVQVLATVVFVMSAGVLLLVHENRTDAILASLVGDERLRVLNTRFREVMTTLNWSIVLPALIGVFWGTPLLGREFEHGTHLLAWTQSVSRRAWLGVKLAGLGAVVTAAGLVFGLATYRWATEFGPLLPGGRLANDDLFVTTGIVPAAWWLFAFVLGVAAGAVLRKLLPAMAVTLAVFFVAYTGMSVRTFVSPMRRRCTSRRWRQSCVATRCRSTRRPARRDTCLPGRWWCRGAG